MGDGARPWVKENWERYNNRVIEIEAENASTPAPMCICNRGQVTTIFGCDDCWREYGTWYVKENNLD